MRQVSERFWTNDVDPVYMRLCTLTYVRSSLVAPFSSRPTEVEAVRRKLVSRKPQYFLIRMAVVKE